MTTKPPPIKQSNEEAPIVKSLLLLDPLLQFLTKKSGKTSVALNVLGALLPCGPDLRHQILLHIPELCEIGVLKLHKKASDENKQQEVTWESTAEIGFPSPTDETGGVPAKQNLCGSTKTAAKRRLAVLKRAMKSRSAKGGVESSVESSKDAKPTKADPPNDVETSNDEKPMQVLQKNWGPEPLVDDELCVDEELCHEARLAREALITTFQFKKPPKKSGQQKQVQEHLSKNKIPEFILPRQASYSGSHAAQTVKYDELDRDLRIPSVILKAFGIRGGTGQTKVNAGMLYSHQVKAITTAVNDQHTMVCTSTGSGKSLTFLIPALSAAYNSGVSISDDSTRRGVSLIMFPTKALAQDQFRKLQSLLERNMDLQGIIVPATLDGDCPHEQRAHIAKTANIILTNPDTLHAAILPAWDKLYKRVLAELRYCIIDEAHVYSGLFGTHVALILSRLQRLCVATTCEGGRIRTPTFLASSATLEHPEYHMRLLCPIPSSSQINVLTAVDDGSPRSAKHFFVWNPPLLNMSGESTGSVFHPKPEKCKDSRTSDKKRGCEGEQRSISCSSTKSKAILSSKRDSKDIRSPYGRGHHGINGLRRRHAADETALLLARAIIKKVRCIVFCKTRSVVEWVYERAVAILKRDEATKHLVERVEPYRGGYKLSDRREIEKKLFDNKLLGVVATSALELGVDIGGIQLTLHVGYPTSISSLLQQAGRAGRGAVDQPSLSVVVCFASAAEQFLWKKPACLLSRGISSPRSFPVNAGIVQGHLLCASKEFPLTGKLPVSRLRCALPSAFSSNDVLSVLSDEELFGSEETYETALENLAKHGSVIQFRAAVASGGTKIKAFKAHAFIDKPWMQVSIRSVEPISFSIVDISHPLQRGKMDGIEDEAAVLDSLPYSRVFYHAFPGAIILHRGQKFKVISMTRPPPYDPSLVYKRNMNLAAFAKPTQDKYITRPLSTNTITIVKQIERVDIQQEKEACKGGKEVESPTSVDQLFSDFPDHTEGSFAGCGIVTSKRTVHGYKKLSLITRAEMSRHELSMPDMEYDTFGLWIDAEAEILGPFLGQDYGSGVHALSHALLAVAPLFIPCVRSDLECDHSAYSPTRITLFDERAGGSGTCAELWKSLFIPNGLLAAAVDLLENCESCNEAQNDLGCPACLQSGECVKFNQFLSRSAALVIGRRMLQKLERTELYKENIEEPPSSARRPAEGEDGTPRKKRRIQAKRQAKDLNSARERLFVVGRPTWATDEGGATGCQQENIEH